LGRHFGFSRVHLADITTDEINRRIARLKDTPSEQNHAFVAVRVFLRWCVRNHYLDRSPLEAQQLPARTRSRERVLTAHELGAVYRRALAYPFPYGGIVTLLILTGQRRGEIGALQWSWIKEGTITLPGSITKNKQTHTFPLGSFAKSIVETIPEAGPYLFPAARSHIRGKRTTHFNGWAKAKPLFNKGLEIEPFTLHDLRRTFSSHLAALGVPLHVMSTAEQKGAKWRREIGPLGV
ncbi:MAG: tyrosine-type recombinase/integrase, partial [bacterium]|nr:tyrosine-type recombinase/integrase [bacterium]